MAGALIDLPRLRKVDNVTVEVGLTRAVGDFPSLVSGQYNFIIKSGTTEQDFLTGPQGTGPFSFVSFAPGRSSTFKRNPNYWKDGGPYVDTLVIDTSFTDQTARLNALASGQINVMPTLPYLAAKTQENNKQVQIIRGDGPQAYLFGMLIDRAPFDDVRVRQAMKLMVDREAMIESAFNGFATPANDLLGGTPTVKVPYFNSELKNPYDPEQAKALLKAAGQKG